MPTVETFGPAKPYDVTPPIGPVDVLQAQGLQQRNALAGLQVQAAQQQQQEHNALRQVLSAPGAIGDDGLPTKNALANVLQVSPTAYNSLVTQISNVQQKKALALQEQARAENQQADTLKKYGEAIKAGKERALGVALDMAKATGSDDAGNRAGNVEWAKQMDEWTASNAVPKEVLKNAPKDFSIPAFQSMLLDYKTRMEMQSREENRAPAIHTFPVGKDDAATVQWNPKTGQYDLIAGSKRKDPTFNIGSTLTPEAKELAADLLIKGQPVNLGIGGSAAKAEILNEAATRGKTAGDVVSERASLKTDTASLAKQAQMYDAVKSFSKTADYNGEYLSKLADKVDSTGVPVIERWTRAGKQAIAGDPDVSAFNAQLNLYRNEAAKILSNPNMSGVLTVESQREAQKWLDGSATPTQIRSVVKTLARDFSNREKAMGEQMAETKGRISGKPAASSAPKVVNFSDLP